MGQADGQGTGLGADDPTGGSATQAERPRRWGKELNRSTPSGKSSRTGLSAGTDRCRAGFTGRKELVRRVVRALRGRSKQVFGRLSRPYFPLGVELFSHRGALVLASPFVSDFEEKTSEGRSTDGAAGLEASVGVEGVGVEAGLAGSSRTSRMLGGVSSGKGLRLVAGAGAGEPSGDVRPGLPSGGVMRFSEPRGGSVTVVGE